MVDVMVGLEVSPGKVPRLFGEALCNILEHRNLTSYYSLATSHHDVQEPKTPAVSPKFRNLDRHFTNLRKSEWSVGGTRRSRRVLE